MLTLPVDAMKALRQVIDTARFSLEEFCDYSNCIAPDAIAGPARRDITDALATVNWFRRIQQRSKWARPYAIGRAVEPEAYWKKTEHERFHRNKWPKYARGLHRPHPVLVDIAERVYPGSAKKLNSVIWAILKHPPSSERRIAEFEERLAPDVQLAISRWRPRVQASKNGSNKRLAGALERIASRDALAAMMLRCHAAILAGNSNDACEWVARMYRCLMMVGTELLTSGIAQPLFELIELRVFKQVSHEGWRYYFPEGRYLEAVGALSDALWHIKGVPYGSMSPAKKVSYQRRFLDGDFGWDLRFACSPYRRPWPEDALILEDDLDNCRKDLNLFAWAWTTLRDCQPHSRFPPVEVLDGTVLSSMRLESPGIAG